MGKASNKYYAVRKGHAPGVYEDWSGAEQQIKGFKGALHKSFKTLPEAQSWLNGAGGVSPAARKSASSRSPSTASASASASRISASGSSAARERAQPYSKTQAVEIRAKGKNTHSAKKQFDPARLAASDDWMTAYADGACRGNGKSGAVAGIGVHWVSPTTMKDIAERLPGKQTNQCAELYAIVRIFQLDPSPSKPLMICTDSKYAVDCLTTWIKGWRKRNWKNASGEPVQNKELIQLADALFQRRSGPVKFEWVPGHSGVEANEKADALAVEGSRAPWVPEMDWIAEVAKLEETPEREVSDVGDDWLLSTEEEVALAQEQHF